MPTDLRVQLPTPEYKVEQIVEKRSHFYGVTFDDGRTPLKFPGVTGYLGVISKPALYNWYASEATKKARAALISKLEGKKSKKVTLTEEWIDHLMLEAKKAPEKAKDDAADLGTEAHAYFERFITGQPALAINPKIQPAVDAFNKWVETSGLHLVGGDTNVASLIHGYGGALDALAVDDDGAWVLIDWKTSSGTYNEYALQVAAYAQAFKETYGIQCWRAIIVRFSKIEPVEFEAKEVANLRDSLEMFLTAKQLKEGMAKEAFL